MISGFATMPFAATSAAAPRMASICISRISGKTRSSRQPRSPSMGVSSSSRARRGVHDPEDLAEVLGLERQQALEVLPPLLLVAGQDHGLHVRQALGLAEHVLGARQTDALGAEAARAAA